MCYVSFVSQAASSHLKPWPAGLLLLFPLDCHRLDSAINVHTKLLWHGCWPPSNIRDQRPQSLFRFFFSFVLTFLFAQSSFLSLFLEREAIFGRKTFHPYVNKLFLQQMKYTGTHLSLTDDPRLTNPARLSARNCVTSQKKIERFSSSFRISIDGWMRAFIFQFVIDAQGIGRLTGPARFSHRCKRSAIYLSAVYRVSCGCRLLVIIILSPADYVYGGT